MRAFYPIINANDDRTSLDLISDKKQLFTCFVSIYAHVFKSYCMFGAIHIKKERKCKVGFKTQPQYNNTKFYLVITLHMRSLDWYKGGYLGNARNFILVFTRNHAK